MVLAFAIAPCLISCSDDDSDEGNSAGIIEMEDMTAEELEMDHFLGIVAEVYDLPEDWRSETFEPVYGVVLDEAAPYVRYVEVEDAEEAYDEYCDLIHFSLFDDDSNSLSVGNIRLVYTPLQQSDVFATVDVDIPQMPHLTQIRFVPPSAMPENGKATVETPGYYFIGDVIMDRAGCYWTCITHVGAYTYWASMQLKTSTLSSMVPSSNKVLNFKDWYNNYPDGYCRVPMALNDIGKDSYVQYFIDLMVLMAGKKVLNKEDFPANLGETNYSGYNTTYLNYLKAAWMENEIFDKVLPEYMNFNYFINNKQYNVFYWYCKNNSVYYIPFNYMNNYKNNGKVYVTLTIPTSANSCFDIFDYAYYGMKDIQHNNISGAPQQGFVLRITRGDKFGSLPYNYNARIYNTADILVKGKAVNRNYR